jgi:hypothetical protein
VEIGNYLIPNLGVGCLRTVWWVPTLAMALTPLHPRCKPMEMTVKVRLLLTSALFLFAQVPTMQAQVTADVVKITCEQLLIEKLPWTARDVVL